MANLANLFVDQGSDYSNIITVRTSSGEPLNLSGFTVASQIRKSFSSSVAYSFQCSVVSATSGQVRLQLSSAASEQIPPGRYLYDVEVTSPTNIKTRVVEGVLTLTPQITKI